ncbi:MAG: hypothetical protein GX555_16750, partial [Actinomycetales bacterium]|nr:hypothetical protein [Actinomycetales bacterium]
MSVPVRRHLSLVLPAAMVASLLVTAGSTSSPPTDATATGRGGPPQAISIEVLSSAPDHVSGGDALVEVTGPAALSPEKLRVTLNGEDVTADFDVTPEGTLVGLVDELEEGRNTIRAEAERSAPPRGKPVAKPAVLRLTNHSKEGPMFSGPQQQPFVCTTARGTFDGQKLLGQPIVDNQDSQGIRVAMEDEDGSYPQDDRGYPTDEAEIVGWSANCAAETRVG